MFAIVHDLSNLSEDQRKQYCRDYSTYLGLNPDENRIDTIWMNSDNVRALVAYCRRGTTDMLRDIFNIDIASMVREDGPGFVAYQASGVNRRGRKEIAVGAYATAGLTGDRLAAAVATAETRAGRRLTLKFIGGGLLDESEVSNTVVTDGTGLPGKPAPVQPQVKANEEVGKPVQANIVNHEANYTLDRLSAGLPQEPIQTAIFPPSILLMPKLTPDPAPVVAVPASIEAANAIIAASTPLEPAKPERKPRKPRGPNKSKNTVDMGDAPEAGVEPTHHEPAIDIPKEKPVDKLTYVPTCPVCTQFMAADERLDMFLCIKDGRIDTAMKPSMLKAGTPPPPVAPIPETPKVAPPKAISVLTDVEQKQVKARLAPFWCDILPKGGMTADDGISVWGKLIKFANQFYAEQPDYKQWPFAAWEVFFEFLDETNAAKGAAALVEQINGKINAA